MNILALDCATITGYATQIDGTIETGIQDFSKRRGETNGILFMRFNKWLNEINKLAERDVSIQGRETETIGLSKKRSFNIVVCEKAHHRGGGPTEIGVGLFTRAMEFAAKIDAEFMPVHSGTLKKFYTGSGNCSKPAMMGEFKRRVGRDAVSSDEADAHALLMFGKEEFGV